MEDAVGGLAAASMHLESVVTNLEWPSIVGVNIPPPPSLGAAPTVLKLEPQSEGTSRRGCSRPASSRTMRLFARTRDTWRALEHVFGGYCLAVQQQTE